MVRRELLGGRPHKLVDAQLDGAKVRNPKGDLEARVAAPKVRPGLRGQPLQSRRCARAGAPGTACARAPGQEGVVRRPEVPLGPEPPGTTSIPRGSQTVDPPRAMPVHMDGAVVVDLACTPRLEQLSEVSCLARLFWAARRTKVQVGVASDDNGR